MIVSAISFQYICPDALAASEKEEEVVVVDRFATCEVEERISVEERGAERLSPLTPPSPLISALGQLPASSRASARL